MDGGRPLRALHVINGLFFGGGHRSTMLLMKGLEEGKRIETRLCTLGEHRGSPLEARRSWVVEYDGRYNRPHVLLSAARRLRGVIEAYDPDIVHTHGLDADLIGLIAARRRGARHVSHLRITPPINRRESWRAAVRRRLVRYLTARQETWFIAVSEAVRQQMAAYYGLPLNRIVTVRNGVDPDEFSVGAARSRKGGGEGPPGPLIVGAATRLGPMKGLEYLIDAVGRLKTEGFEFQLWIAGSGSDAEALERRVEALGLGEEVRFLGAVCDMPAFYRQLDLFVLPSLSEGLPLVVLEAMAMRLPVVATRIGGTPEAVEDGVEGLLVPSADAEALSAAIARLGRDAPLRQRMGEAGHARVRSEFTIERVTAEVARVYECVLDEQRVPLR